MIDLTEYDEKKAKGLVRVARTNPDDELDNATYAVSEKRWDEETGIKKADEVRGITRQELVSRKAEIAAEIKQIDNFLVDAEA